MKKQKNVKKNRKQSIYEGAGSAAGFFTTVLLILMIAVFPFYIPGGYRGIGSQKFYFFRDFGIFAAVFLVPAALVRIFTAPESFKTMCEKLSLTDKMVLGYGGTVVISYLVSNWKADALWGSYGWYMGLGSQLLFVFFYFAASRFGPKFRTTVRMLLAASAAVFLLGLLNRFSIYPFKVAGAIPSFISTLGNINWYCSYWAVVFPLGAGAYWIQETEGRRVPAVKGLLLFYVALGLATGVTQGSNSAILPLFAVFAILFFASFSDNRRFLKWLELALCLAAVCLGVGLVRLAAPEAVNYYSEFCDIMTGKSALPVWGGLLAVFAVLWGAVFKNKLEISRYCRVRNGIGVLVLCCCAVLTGVIVFYSFKPGGLIEVMDMLGNGRGTTWQAGIQAYLKLPFWRKLIGVGPDCFSKIVYSLPEIAEPVVEVFGDAKLTNAHNEWLTVLVNYGFFGALFFIGTFLSAWVRQMKEAARRPVLWLTALCLLGYTAHNLVSFQQVICTPLIFLLLGTGEKELRAEKDS